jgi:hypothetical protein
MLFNSSVLPAGEHTLAITYESGSAYSLDYVLYTPSLNNDSGHRPASISTGAIVAAVFSILAVTAIFSTLLILRRKRRKNARSVDIETKSLASEERSSIPVRSWQSNPRIFISRVYASTWKSRSRSISTYDPPTLLPSSLPQSSKPPSKNQRLKVTRLIVMNPSSSVGLGSTTSG